MAITFNDKLVTMNRIRHYTGDGGVMTNRGNGWDLIDLFDSTDTAGAFLTFGLNRSDYTKYNGIYINIDTPLVADSINIVWEYCRRGSNSYEEIWYPLQNVNDGTNNFTTSGEITWDMPEDWENFLRVQGNGDWYYWVVRARIESVTNMTNGGKASSVKCRPYMIYVTSGTDANPVTFEMIYTESVNNGWNVIEKNDRVYTFNCGIRSEVGYVIRSTQEVIQFKKNYDCFFLGKMIIGDIISAEYVKNGSTFIFNMYNVDLYGVLAGEDSIIVNTQYRYVNMEGSSVYHGHWGGGLGTRANQTIKDVYSEYMRQYAFNNKSNVIIGAKGYGFHIETPGAIIKNAKVYGGNYCIRTLVEHDNDYIHECDIGNPVNNPISAYRSSKLENFKFSAVDCEWGRFKYMDNKYKVKWTIFSSDPFYKDTYVYEKYSISLKILDYNNMPLNNARVRIWNNKELIYDIHTNEDGYIGIEKGSITNSGSDFIEDDSKNYTLNQYHFREILITSGTGEGQRRIIKYGSSGNRLNIAPEFDEIPSVGDRWVIIPYITVVSFQPPNVTETGSYLSNPEDIIDYNPITIEISKPGYKTYKKTITLDKKIEWVIKLKSIYIEDYNIVEY